MKKSQIIWGLAGLGLLLLVLTPEDILPNKRMLVFRIVLGMALLMILNMGYRILKDSSYSVWYKGITLAWLALGLVLIGMEFCNVSGVLVWLGSYTLVGVVLTLVMMIFEKVK